MRPDSNMMDSIEKPSPGSAEGGESASEGAVTHVRRRRSRGPRGGFAKLFLRDHWFGMAVVSFGLLVLVLVALLPHIWKVSPPWTSVIRISGLDFLQARSLKKTAKAALARGDVKAALAAWQGAVSSDLTDLEALRGVLQGALMLPDVGPGHGGSAPRLAIWLLNVGATNQSDVNLAIRVFGRLEQDDHVISLGDQRLETLDAAATAALFAAEFRLGKMEKFVALWNARSAILATNADSVLFHSVWEAGWGPAERAAAGRRALEAAEAGTDGRLAVLAHRLRLRLATAGLHLDEYRKALAWLEERHTDRVSEQVGLWRLLVAAGARGDAISLAKSFSRAPETAKELTELARAMSDLGLTAEATTLMEREIKRFPESMTAWADLARMRIHAHQWSELRQTALAMRETGVMMRTVIEGYSDFMTGYADLQLKRTESADQEFKKAISVRGWEPSLAFECAGMLRAADRPALAEELIGKAESSFRDRAEFWFELGLEAFAAGDFDGFARASAKAYALAPDRAGAVNNYAAALLLTRDDPGKALDLTGRVYNLAPNNPAVVINRAEALVQVGRLDDASGLLAGLDEGRLTPNEAAAANFCRAEFQLKKGDPTKARAIYATVPQRMLMAPQRKWMEDQLAKAAAAGAADAGSDSNQRR
jgi:predicted Zn-dependent protease